MIPPPSATFALPPENALYDPTAFDWAGFRPFQSSFVGVSAFDASDASQIRPYLNWVALFQRWEVPIPFPSVVDHPDWGQVARNLLRDANALLDSWLAEDRLRPQVVFGVWPARAEGNQVVVRSGDEAPVRLPFPRLSLANGQSYCLADFIKPATALKANESDYLGGYVIRLGEEIQQAIQRCQTEGDLYRAFLSADLCALYTSALADYLHYRLRRFIWAYCDDDDLSNQEVVEGLHQGIRVVISGPECPDPAEALRLRSLLAGPVPEAGTVYECGYFFAHPKSRLLAEINQTRSPESG